MRKVKTILGILITVGALGGLAYAISHEPVDNSENTSSDTVAVASATPTATPSAKPSAKPASGSGSSSTSTSTSSGIAYSGGGSSSTSSQPSNDIDAIVQAGVRAATSTYGCKNYCDVRVRHIVNGYALSNTKTDQGTVQQLFAWDGNQWNVILQKFNMTKADARAQGVPAATVDRLFS